MTRNLLPSANKTTSQPKTCSQIMQNKNVFLYKTCVEYCSSEHNFSCSFVCFFYVFIFVLFCCSLDYNFMYNICSYHNFDCFTKETT